MTLIYLKSALKHDSFEVAIDIKISFFKVLELGRSLYTVRYHELFERPFNTEYRASIVKLFHQPIYISSYSYSYFPSPHQIGLG